MGVGAMVYRRVRRLGCRQDAWCERSEDETHTQAYNMIEFRERALEIEGPESFEDDSIIRYGCFTADGADIEGFHIGAYSYYNRYREWLSMLSHDVMPRIIWNDESYEGKPFVEQINFADNEGTLGTAVCKKLAKDYNDFLARAREVTKVEDLKSPHGFYAVYLDFKKGFEFASDNGFLELH
jgi:hypothetical protein